jgi:hypothetical protein
MADLKNRFSREELDALTLSTPQARASYEAARLGSQVGREPGAAVTDLPKLTIWKDSSVRWASSRV